MGFIKLVINELIKAFKKKSTLIFIILAIISIIASCILVYVKKNSDMVEVSYGFLDELDVKTNISILKLKLNSDISEYEKKVCNENIRIYQFLLDEGVDKIIDSQFKNYVVSELGLQYEKLYSIDQNNEEYIKQKENVDRLWGILKNGSFEEYIQFNKDLILQSYDVKEITHEEYISKIESQNELLKYEVGKYMPENDAWKNEIINYNSSIRYMIEERFDFKKHIYIDDENVANLKEQMLINEYRLENNIAPYYTDEQSDNNINSYSRYKFNEFANTLSIILIGLLIIVLAASSISEEISKGTIKFMLITPYRRYKILLAKIIAISIILMVSVFIISQISVIVGNIVFGSDTNNYLYVSNGEVKVMNTHLYETLQYLLRIPELFIYLLIAITLSTLTKNTSISTIITSSLFIGFSLIIQAVNQFMTMNFFKYLPFENFGLVDKVLKLEIYSDANNVVVTTDLKFTIIVLSITAILFIITAFESFNKKDIN